jgi:hypothetical protein
MCGSVAQSERLRAAETSGPGGLNLRYSNLLIVPRLLDGTPGYCCSGGTPADAGPVPSALMTWLVGVLVVAALGVVWSVSERRLPEMMLVCLPASLLAAFYLLLPRFTTLRFLLPVRSALLACGLRAGSRNETVAQNRGRHHRGGSYWPCRPYALPG